MSWGAAAEGAGNSGAAGSAVGNGVSSVSSPAFSGGGAAGSGVNAGSAPAYDTGGFNIDAANGARTAQGPSFMDRGADMLDRFKKGGSQDVMQAWQNRGNNPETYGYMMGKLNSMTNSNNRDQRLPPMTTNVSYQQPQNEYLKRRGY
jgi:hypothetical protein